MCQQKKSSRAAGNQSLGGGKEKERIKVAVGEGGWHGYLYLESRNAAVILLSVCETFLHFRCEEESHGDVAQCFFWGISVMMMSSKMPDRPTLIVGVEWAAGSLISSSALVERITDFPNCPCVYNLLMCAH